MKKVKHRIIFISIVVAYSTLITSCATVFRGVNPNKTILITGKPENANVIVDGKVIGQTPFNYEMKKRKTKFVQISKNNFEDYNTKIETKLNPLWTAISVVGGGWLFAVPTAIDFTNGSLRNIKTDKIEYDLKPIKKDNESKPSQNTIEKKSSTLSENEDNDQISNPRVRIRTGTREFILGYKSCVAITTLNGLKIGSNIKEIENDYLVLAKNDTKIYYKDIAKIRMYPMRRWFPIITFYTVLSPVFWFVSSKTANSSSTDCKKQIKEIKVINKYSGFGYGKDKCR
jgi:hypothetical protein